MTPTPQPTQIGLADILKKNVLDNFTFGDIDITRILATLGLGLVIGLFIFFIYRKTFAGVLYSRTFNISLIMLTMVTAFVIMPITSNLTLTLGMVGALSIIRFRTAVKDPVDTVFMFWAVAAGIALGAKFWLPALCGSLVIGLAMVIISIIKIKFTMPYLLVLRFDEESLPQVREILRQMPQGRLKSKTVSAKGIELTLELRLKDKDLGIVDRFLRVQGVHDASLVSYQGDIVS
ncbi:MAG: DUF4956 domain-containing protein [Bacillota bacterium]|nr:DUF4956 domain-containing protein [Bacillota bacterium]